MRTIRSFLPFTHILILLRYRHWLALHSHLSCLATQFQKRLSYPNVKTAYKIVLSYLFVKSHFTFNAITLLCKNGYGMDSFILARSLLENYVDMAYIAADPISRSKAFLEWEAIDKKRWLDCVENDPQWMAVPLIHKSTIDNEKRINEEYDQREHLFPEKHLGWSQKPITDRIKTVGASMLPLYKRLCCYTHPAISTLNDYVEDYSEKTLKSYGNPNQNGLYEMFPTSYNLFYNILEKLNAEFKLGAEQELEELKKQRDIVWNKQKHIHRNDDI